MKKIFFALIVLLGGFSVNIALAQPYPSKPIRLVVPFPPGGPTDLLARTLGQKLQERIGQSVIIDNKPGGQNIIGAQFAARSAPDGQTFYFATTAALVTNKFLFKIKTH